MHGSAVIATGLAAPQVERAGNPLLDDAVWSTQEEWKDFTSLDGGEMTAGVKVNTRTALGYAPFWRAVTLMGSDMGSFPIVVYKRVETEFGEGKERDRKHPANVINRRPNPYMSRYTFIQTLIIHAGRKGNGYAYVRRDGGGRPKELLILSPESTWPVRRNGVLWYVTEVNGKLLRIEAEDVIHIKGPGDDGLIGYDVLTYAKKTLGLALATREHRINFYKNGARPSVVLEAPGQIPPKVLKQLKKSWGSLYSGVANHHRTAILQMGVSAKHMSQNARDAQLIEGQELDVYHISAITGVPPHKIGGRGRGGYASLEAENEAYMSDCIAHLVTACEQEFGDKLLTEKEKASESHTIEIMTAAKVKANLLTRMQAYSLAINARVIVPNEARAKEGLNPTEWGNVPVDNQKSASGTTGGDSGSVNEEQVAKIVKQMLADLNN